MCIYVCMLVKLKCHCTNHKILYSSEWAPGDGLDPVLKHETVK